MAPLISRLAVIGVGLIGGSFALALKSSGAVGHVVGLGRRLESLARAHELGVIDSISTDPEAVAECDFVLLASPVGSFEPLLRSIAPHLSLDAVVTDGGSTKRDVVAAARAALGAKIGQFVPGHPIAGAEKSGADAANPKLYQDRKVILTPLPENPQRLVDRVAQVWERCGATLHRMTAEQHDQVLAAVSHLPHVLAYALVEQVSRHPQTDLLWQHAAGGFRDFTRIASSHPEMWRDICVANRDALLAEIDRFDAVLAEIRGLVDRGDGASLEAWFERARDARNSWLAQFEGRGRPT